MKYLLFSVNNKNLFTANIARDYFMIINIISKSATE